MSTPNWNPFVTVDAREKVLPPRAIETVEGLGDRMRVAAFAELQAIHAFQWAVETFTDAPNALKAAWTVLAGEERNHYAWLIKRMGELSIDLRERKVSDRLWHSFLRCKTAKDFSLYIATAEHRGMVAGDRVAEQIKEQDPESSRIFAKIAFEEIGHIDHVIKFYPELREQFEKKVSPTG